MSESEPTPTADLDFVRKIVKEDCETNKWDGRVQTRFPPEPNGYLHIGHAKAICLNFGIANEFGGKCNLRFDDTNPTKEEQEYVDSIQEDIRWLGFEWNGDPLFASDYFEQLYKWAIQLIKEGKAYVDDLTGEEIREHRGTLTKPGKESPHRNRPPEESLKLFEEMKEGKYPDGTKTLRAKIDMASPNLNMRDPVLYRILHASHHRTGDKWCIYPMYDWAHGQSDSIEQVTHSICTLEFENHRPLYDWCLDALDVYHPQQIEFARLNLTYTMMSKRKLLQLVQEKIVSGWDDPRMPTISGYRRRGYTPTSLRTFCDRIGVSKFNSTIDVGVLEQCLRDDLEPIAHRRLVVLRPLKVVITNYPEDQVEDLNADNIPKNEEAGTRTVPFSRELYIEKSDFQEIPEAGFKRLKPGGEVRLRFGYWIKCEEVIKDDSGDVIELRCTYDPETIGVSKAPDGRKVKGTIHWVSAEHAIQAEVRMYDRLFLTPDPNDVEEGEDFKVNLNPDSLVVLEDAKLEPSLAEIEPGVCYQFERQGYFCGDVKDWTKEKPVFNCTVALKNPWEKKSGK